MSPKTLGRIGCAGYWIFAALFSLVFVIGDCFDQQCREESDKQFLWYWVIMIAVYAVIATSYRSVLRKDKSD